MLTEDKAATTSDSSKKGNEHMSNLIGITEQIIDLCINNNLNYDSAIFVLQKVQRKLGEISIIKREPS